MRNLRGLDDTPGGIRLFAVFTFGNLNGWTVFDVAGKVGISILMGCVKKGELIPILPDVVVATLLSLFEANEAAVSRSFPPPMRFMKILNV